MSALLWRVIIAVLGVVLIFALLPPLFRIVGFPLDGDLLMVLKICIAGIAVFYVLRGPAPPCA
jgi:hypothetical protein